MLSSSDSLSILSLNSTFEENIDVITIFTRVLVNDVTNNSTLLKVVTDDAELSLEIATSLALVAYINE